MSVEGRKPFPLTTKPLLDSSSLSNRSSYSSESSDVSSSKIFLNLDRIPTCEMDNDPTEDQLLLSHTSQKKFGKNDDLRKPRPILFKQTIVQSQEIVL